MVTIRRCDGAGSSQYVSQNMMDIIKQNRPTTTTGIVSLLQKMYNKNHGQLRTGVTMHRNVQAFVHIINYMQSGWGGHTDTRATPPPHPLSTPSPHTHKHAHADTNTGIQTQAHHTYIQAHIEAKYIEPPTPPTPTAVQKCTEA